MQRALYSFLICIALTATTTSAANADVFNDLDEWLSAVPPVTVIDFTGFPPDTLITDQYSELGITFEPNNNIASFIASNSAYSDGFGLANNSGRIIMQFDEPLTIIGSLFPGIQRIELYFEGEQVGSSGNQGCFDSVGCFVGLISDVPFDEAHVMWTTFVSIDNLYFTFAPIPAPGAMALLGIAGFAFRRSRLRDNEKRETHDAVVSGVQRPACAGRG